ncbi:spherulation-specific family 4 protein [Kitasatospora purpeofusca]|uniref:spherulation-specific family 4 protein n=1 Tax=Kitasatospora purpeofusca TaxID=67352 RepID=UPI002A5A2FD9|nr:spherulation-specific family 4 protein [Kitasatospora purpeofusca]MDY0811706.1 spherulation-specific family 4 protein [Kitasatospora purpeofusca]
MTGGSHHDGRLLVPLYVHPAVDPAAWQAVAAADPGRIAAVVLNLADGPGDPDHVFAEAAEELRRAGLPLLGYADTDYGRRPHAAVVQDVLTYRQRHGITGVYLDQVSTAPGALPHYRRLATAARAAGCATVVFGHGDHPDPGYAEVGLADLLVTFEGDWTAYQGLALPLWTGRHAAARFCHLVYDVPVERSGEATALIAARRAGVGCAVPGTGDNPWRTLPHELTVGRPVTEPT